MKTSRMLVFFPLRHDQGDAGGEGDGDAADGDIYVVPVVIDTDRDHASVPNTSRV